MHKIEHTLVHARIRQFVQVRNAFSYLPSSRPFRGLKLRPVLPIATGSATFFQLPKLYCILFYYIDKSVLVENRPLVKFIRNYIRDSSGVLSISSLVRISMTSFPTLTLLFVQKYSCLYNEKKIARWLEDMNFTVSW